MLSEAAGIASPYPFGEVDKVGDIGGGRGTLLSEVLLHHEGVKGVLVDAPSVLESAKGLLQARGVADRVELVPGSFFDTVPSGADADTLKSVLHDWDDERVKNYIAPIARVRNGDGCRCTNTFFTYP